MTAKNPQKPGRILEGGGVIFLAAFISRGEFTYIQYPTADQYDASRKSQHAPFQMFADEQ